MSGDMIRGAGASVLRARWQVQLVAAVVLAAAGVVMLLDQGRAELVVGLVVGAYLLIEGVGFIVGRMGSEGAGRAGEIDALRAGIGLLTAALLFGLSYLEAITLSGVRLIIAIGGIPFGLLGVWLVILTRSEGFRWGNAAVDLLVVAFAVLLLLTEFVDAAAFGGVLAVAAWASIVVAAILAVVALVRARSGAVAAPEG